MFGSACLPACLWLGPLLAPSGPGRSSPSPPRAAPWFSRFLRRCIRLHARIRIPVRVHIRFHIRLRLCLRLRICIRTCVRTCVCILGNSLRAPPPGIPDGRNSAAEKVCPDAVPAGHSPSVRLQFTRRPGGRAILLEGQQLPPRGGPFPSVGQTPDTVAPKIMRGRFTTDDGYHRARHTAYRAPATASRTAFSTHAPPASPVFRSSFRSSHGISSPARPVRRAKCGGPCGTGRRSSTGRRHMRAAWVDGAGIRYAGEGFGSGGAGERLFAGGFVAGMR